MFHHHNKTARIQTVATTLASQSYIGKHYQTVVYRLVKEGRSYEEICEYIYSHPTNDIEAAEKSDGQAR